ncbi:MAG: exodeoxyribonuclease VII large subunit, partial [Eubacterium sp.]|nr:exodeoxyribonuclease VII large subunit [Eubacterium sp.]
GEGAGEKIAQVIDMVNEKFPETEILIVGRGGGSAEDLWAFNEEAVARSIYRSAIPVVSAVGHEIDFTISDMVADVRAATPTAAAQIAVPDTGELLEEIRKRKQELLQQLQNKVMYQSLIAENLAESMRQTCLNRIDSAQQKLEAEKRLLEAHDPRAILSLGYAIAETEDGTVVTDSRQLAPDDQIRLQFRTGAAAARITEVRGDEE